MQKKVIKYGLSGFLLLFLAYHSVYFKKLDEVKLASSSKGFDAPAYARNFYNKLLPRTDSAIETGRLLSLLKSEPDSAFRNYAHALDIGNVRYFLVQGEGTILSLDENAVTVSLKNDSLKADVKIATEFVYGNAIRDAAGLVNLNDFSSTSDFNAVSEETNKIVRKEVIPAFKAKAKEGSDIRFWGAIELNQKHLTLDSIEVIPIRLLILK